jgi:hypothetical protein
MKMRIGTIASMAVLLIALVALAGPAYASGNGNGNGQGNANAQAGATQASSSGKSAEAPGQVKENAQQPVAVGASSPASSKAKNQGKSRPGSAVGVKPSSSTDHNVSAPAGSSATKLYGSGQTAGQIAIQHGASANAMLYGPGNSEPHKVVPCGQPVHGKGGGPDVHALKNSGQMDCGSRPPSTKPTGDPSPSSTPVSSKPQPIETPARGPRAVKSSDKDASSGGVLSSIANVRDGSLPFTGFPLWSAVVIALGVVGAGVMLRRHARAVA